MVYRASSGIAEQHLGLRLQRGNSLSGLCVAEGRPLRCDDSETDARVDGDDLTRLLDVADQSMYMAKRKKKLPESR